MAILLNIVLKACILKIMHDIWKKKQRVTYYDFSEFVRKNHPLETTLHIPKHTFSVSPSKRVMLPIANKCISTNLPIFYRILHVLETMNYPFSNNYLYNQMSKTFLPQSVPQVMAS